MSTNIASPPPFDGAWYVAIEDSSGKPGKIVGPIELGEMRDRAKAGSLTQKNLVWKAGMDDWAPAGTVRRLDPVFEEARNFDQAGDSKTSPGADSMDSGGLFDFSFSTFVTTRLVTAIYVISVFLIFVGAIASALSILRDPNRSGVEAFAVPFAALFAILVVRIWLEMIVVLFRIAENTTQLVRNSSGSKE